MPLVFQFWWRWLATALGHSWNVYERITGCGGVALFVASRYKPLPTDITDKLTEIALVAFVLLFVVRMAFAPYWMHERDVQSNAALMKERDMFAAVAAGRKKNQTLADELTELRRRATHDLVNTPPTVDNLAEWMPVRNAWLNEVVRVMKHHGCTDYEISLVHDIQRSEVLEKLKPYKQSYNVMMIEVRLKYLNAIIQSYEDSPASIRKATS